MAVVIPAGQGSVIRVSAKKRTNVEIPFFPGGETALWGKIYGDIDQQADLKAKLNKITKIAKAAL